MSWLTRARLKRDAGIAALAPTLLPNKDGDREAASHRLIWSMFAGDPDKERDFLWREADRGEMLVLSEEKPEPDNAVLEIHSKPFAPVLSAGDRLRFDLRVNATKDVSTTGQRSHRADIIMSEIYASRNGKERREARAIALYGDNAGQNGRTQSAINLWLAARSEVAGFEIEDTHLKSYQTLQIPREGRKAIMLGVCEVQGVLRVTEPDAFMARLRRGFGRAKSFGCGLMLIRRA